MILTIDTKNKTIELKENVRLNELYSTLDKMFPNGWGDYTLVVAGYKSMNLNSGTGSISPYITTTKPSSITYGTGFETLTQ